MNKLKIITISIIILLFSVVAYPISIAENQNNIDEGDIQHNNDNSNIAENNDVQEPDINFIDDTDPPLFISSGGPYHGAPGEIIQFRACFSLLESDYINVTGYSWEFGDGDTYSYDFDTVISFTESPIECTVDHVYSTRHTYHAKFIIHYDEEDIYPENIPDRDINSGKFPDPIIPIINNHVQTQVFIEYDPWDEYLNPNNYFKKLVWDEETGWSETTSHHIGDTIRFKVSYNPTSRIENVEIKDYLPPTVRFVTASPPPDSIQTKIYFNDTTNEFNPKTELIWNVGDLLSGDSVEIIIEGVVEYLDKDYFGIIDDEHPIYYSTENIAKLKGQKQSPGCGNPYAVRYTAAANFIILPNTEPEIEIEIEKFVWDGNSWAKYGEVDIGEIVNFKAIITNPMENYTIHFSGVVFDQLPYNLRYINESCTIYGDYPNLEYVDWKNNTVYWYKAPTIQPGDALTFYYNATAVDCCIGVNNLTAHPEGFDPIPGYPGDPVDNHDGTYDVSDEVTINVICDPCNPDIELVKSVKFNCNGVYSEEGIIVPFGQWVTFRINVTNIGDVPLDVVVCDELPLGMTYLDDAMVDGVSQEPVIDGNSYCWDVGLVIPGQKVIIEFRAVGDGCETYVNIANVVGTFEDYEVSDEDSAFVTVECDDPPVLGVDVVKSVKFNCNGVYSEEGIIVPFGQWVTFRINVTNIGDVPLDVVVCDELPLGMTYLDDAMVDGVSQEPVIDGNSYCWDVGLVIPGQKVIIEFRAVGDGCETYVNIANVVGTFEDYEVSDEDSAFVTVECDDPPVLGVDVVKSAKNSCNGIYSEEEITVESGQSVTFRINVSNTGETPLEIILCDTLHEGLIYLNSAKVGDVPQEPDIVNNNYYWNLGVVEPGQKIIVTFHASSEEPGQFINSASAEGTHEEITVSDSDTVSVIVVEPTSDPPKEEPENKVNRITIPKNLETDKNLNGIETYQRIR